MSAEENKQVARKYHELNPDDVEEILTPDFVGRHNPPEMGFGPWNRDQHKRFLTNTRGTMVDTIHQQIAEGDWVATRFTRGGMYKGKQVTIDLMHFKRFEGGKIAEIWEYWNPQQLEQQLEP